MAKKVKRLYRSDKNKVIAGVCGGLGEFMGVDPVIIRLLFVLATLLTFGFGGILFYLFAWIIMPKRR